MEELNKSKSNSIGFSSDSKVDLGEILKENLILNNVCIPQNIDSLGMKLKVRGIENYKGNFFQNIENNCFIRYFANNPTLLAIICEYEYDNNSYDYKGVEIFLKNSLTRIGYTFINT